MKKISGICVENLRKSARVFFICPDVTGFEAAGKFAVKNT
jgi:hypothetical protein